MSRYSDAPESDFFSCAVCRNRYDSESKVPRILPGCGHTFCQSCIDGIIAKATSEDELEFTCPFSCPLKSRIGVEYHTNWSLKSHLDSATVLQCYMRCYSVAVKLFTELQVAAFASIRRQNAHARNAWEAAGLREWVKSGGSLAIVDSEDEANFMSLLFDKN